MKTDNVVLCGGGVDSAVVAAELVASKAVPLLLFCDYGQRPAVREAAAVRQLAKQLGCPFKVSRVTLPGYASHAMFDPSVALLNRLPLPVSQEFSNSRSNWIVPYRNIFLIALAAMVASRFSETGYSNVWVGFDYRRVDAAKDCSPAMAQALQDVFFNANDMGAYLKIKAPLVELTKEQIYQRAISLNLSIDRLWSCYNAYSYPCGVCAPCEGRKETMKSIGVVDRTRYMTLRGLQQVLTESTYARLQARPAIG